MSAPINYLMNDSEEEELGALIYKSSQTAKKFLGSSASASGGASNTKKRAGSPADDCPARNEGWKLIHERSFRYSSRSASKKLKSEEATDESFCTGESMLQQKQSQASQLKWASSDSESDNEDDSSDDEYPAEPEPSSSNTSRTASKRFKSLRVSHRQASDGATEPEPERFSSTDSTPPPSLSSMYCTVINETRKSTEEMEGAYTDRKGREFVIEQFAGKKYKQYFKPEDVHKKVPRPILLCKVEGCTNHSIKGGVCVKHGAKTERCKFEGCTNQQVKNHLCYRHGAPRKICKYDGCTNIANKCGVCLKHGAKKRHCKFEGCTNQRQAKQLCYRHGAPRKICKYDGCTNIANKGGVCLKHGAKNGHCKFEGCTNQRQAKQLCYRHGAPRKICKYDGCTTVAKARGVCARHVDTNKKQCAKPRAAKQSLA